VIVLDTHVWLWWIAEPPRLSRAARRAIDEAETIGVCAISAWEVATLVRRRRISLDRDVATWVRQALASARVTPQLLTPDVAVAAGLLESDGFPGDPGDRLI
jgi:PIN domain nuclease of toxin-antitoxin system